MAKEIGHPKTIILLVSFLVLQACNAGGGAPSEMSRRPVSYLADIVPPCKPIEGSMRDPCPQALPSVVDSATAATYYYLPDTLRTFTEELTKLPLAVPHIVVRGTVMPGTARCGAYPVSLPNYEPGLHQRSVVDTIHYDCFVEVRVNEYIVGEGPPQLTVSVHQQSLIGPLENWGVEAAGGQSDELDEFMNDPPLQVESVFSGREMVLFLSVTTSIVVESWVAGNSGDRWFVQRDGDEVRAVSEIIYLARTPEHRRRLNMPLADLVREVKQAHENRLVITEGRIGVESFLPMLITDANKLQDYYGAVGAVYEGEGATVLPPPVPGGDEPAQPPAPVGEDPPADTVPAPGEETTSPPPTDDAGHQPSTTAVPPPADPTSTSSPAPGADPAAPSSTVPQPQTEETSPTDAPAPSDDTQPLSGATLPPAEDAPPAPAG